MREENADEPRSVLLRLFGQKIPSEAAACEAAFNELVNAQITDNVIFTLLSGSYHRLRNWTFLKKTQTQESSKLKQKAQTQAIKLNYGQFHSNY